MIRCPHCNYPFSNIESTQDRKSSPHVARGRRCQRCNRRFITYEMSEADFHLNNELAVFHANCKVMLDLTRPAGPCDNMPVEDPVNVEPHACSDCQHLNGTSCLAVPGAANLVAFPFSRTFCNKFTQRR